MAGAAIIRARNVGCRFRCRCHARALRMTAVAVARRAFEYRVHVARFARFVAMRAGQFETGGQMIEIACGRRGGLTEGESGKQRYCHEGDK